MESLKSPHGKSFIRWRLILNGKAIVYQRDGGIVYHSSYRLGARQGVSIEKFINTLDRYSRWYNESHINNFLRCNEPDGVPRKINWVEEAAAPGTMHLNLTKVNQTS